MKIRNAVIDDLEFFRYGLHQVRLIEKRPIEDIPVTEEDMKSFRKGVEEGTIRVIDGDDGTPAAFLFYRMDHRIMYVSGDIFWIDLIFIGEDHRGMGYGKALYHDAVSIAQRMGYERIVIDIFDPNERSKVFHSKLGFDPFYTIYIKDL